MNQFVISTQVFDRSGLQGLPERLVMDGHAGEIQMADALTAGKERRGHIITYFVE